jgi:uncharacterized BrkB/YihY/UPF0761 family membrane protein
VSEPEGTSAVSRITASWAARAADLGRRLEQRRFTGFLIRSYRRFDDIEGKHLALVIGTNLLVALIPLIIVGYAFIERFNPHRTVGVVLVENFHLTGRTAVIVKDTFPMPRRAGTSP